MFNLLTTTQTAAYTAPIEKEHGQKPEETTIVHGTRTETLTVVEAPTDTVTAGKGECHQATVTVTATETVTVVCIQTPNIETRQTLIVSRLPLPAPLLRSPTARAPSPPPLSSPRPALPPLAPP